MAIPHRVPAIVIALLSHALGVCPGAGAWTVCTGNEGCEVYSTLSGCCSCCGTGDVPHHHHDPTGLIESCGDCTDSPLLLPDQTLVRGLPRLDPQLQPGILPVILTQPLLPDAKLTDRQRAWAESLSLDDHVKISTVVLLC